MQDEDVVHIVDDDESLRRALHRLLRSVGYSAIMYASATAVIDAAPQLSGYIAGPSNARHGRA
jgi:FixJ family two-component response regulator